MLTHSKLLLAALASAAMMLTLVANASARSFSLTEKEFEVLFGPATPLNIDTANNTISCPITLLGRFVERTIPKIAGTQVGVIRHAEPRTGTSPSPCTGGQITVLAETLPWSMIYQEFTGALPRITTIRLALIRVSFRIRAGNGIACLIGTTATNPAFGEITVGATGGAEGLRADETIGIPLRGGFICSIAGNGFFRGTGSVLNLPRTASITVTLI